MTNPPESPIKQANLEPKHFIHFGPDSGSLPDIYSHDANSEYMRLKLGITYFEASAAQDQMIIDYEQWESAKGQVKSKIRNEFTSKYGFSPKALHQTYLDSLQLFRQGLFELAFPG